MWICRLSSIFLYSRILCSVESFKLISSFHTFWKGFHFSWHVKYFVVLNNSAFRCCISSIPNPSQSTHVFPILTSTKSLRLHVYSRIIFLRKFDVRFHGPKIFESIKLSQNISYLIKKFLFLRNFYSCTFTLYSRFCNIIVLKQVRLRNIYSDKNWVENFQFFIHSNEK